MIFKTAFAAFVSTLMMSPLSAVASSDAEPLECGIACECCPWSDQNLKTSITPLTDSTAQLLKINGVKFAWKDTGREDIGVIAQNVQTVYPELVHEKEGHLSVDYQKMVAPLIESVRELNARIDALEKAKQ